MAAPGKVEDGGGSKEPLLSVKECGWILTVDQASNDAGCALWKDGNLIATTTLYSDSRRDPIGVRLVKIVTALDVFLDDFLDAPTDLKLVLFEGVKARLVLVTVGAFVTSKYIRHCKIHQKWSFVETRSWKGWARKNGATGDVGLIKGLKALAEVGFPTADILSDDAADAVLLYLTWRERK